MVTDVPEQQKQRSKSSGSLVTKVSLSLRNAIASGQYGPGDRLPSEIEMTEAHGVSRTVVREAVTALRCDGLVEVRQGAGIFVLKRGKEVSSAPGVDRARLSSDLEVLEIRTPLEIEAAGLAALRRSPSQEEAIFDCHARLLECIEQNRSIREADLALHIAVATATNNPLFTQFLELHGQAVIPQSRVVSEAAENDQTAYRRLIHKEHEAIVIAISDRNEQDAKLAMQAHLRGSQNRYRDMMRDLRGIAHS
ncbi:FadR family transcriptional regulator [Rhizobium rhizogenes]|jgi:DNA-binding FadR family transcriptional regulator|uniref:FadR family transcriptional regulator n=2 Tax=Rhizobium/Agrobacterium group TaxID=227290 RepID=A0AA95AG35_RHIRH|nr:MULTISPECIES: FadR/GntR family transcriptional regulator [Rhizobium/Agrobacterium group]KAA3499738.1 FadR family transcriptional regulator [Agrobacterium tumefaciens]MDX8326461.1 FadR/GntR family transcriptional regulator [Agrobacterium tumefaciens]NSY45620.1 FadR family transcriptional regulator [Agrobacterium tumefaciens]NSY61216.1 FadR family transcriptional regulator [Agrobacterium tumefaciens]NSY71563.1 FadR family transcriptional regulator [Agrobacterium tumefaciens]